MVRGAKNEGPEVFSVKNNVPSNHGLANRSNERVLHFPTRHNHKPFYPTLPTAYRILPTAYRLPPTPTAYCSAANRLIHFSYLCIYLWG